ncbi:MAG TPA: lipase maturation factor family protein [Candidatus Limnocylindrales bacterium]|nr:lipase maturation factor family protein [Candidatus Limnocylindrales bacterium]
MPELTAPDYTIARFVIERGLALIYLVAFVVAARQFPALSGERGLQPAPRLLARVRPREAPSLFHWGYSDSRLRVVAWSGAVVAGLLVVGLPQLAPLPVTMLAWLTVWGLYQSIVNIGGTFYGFGWESLLLEAGFLAVFLGNAEIAPPWLVLLAFRWLAFRVEFGAGLIKLRGDRCWRDLTCMDFHHETQPMPNPLSWFFHHLPRPLHRVEVLGNFVAQLILPWALFLPQPIASLAAGLMIATQLYLVVSGNYAWLNWLTIVAAVAGISDDAVRIVLPFLPAADGAGFAATPEWFTIAVLGLSILIVGLSWFPVRNMASPGQAMNASFNALHLVNTYGAFGTVGRERYELVIEGSAAERPAEPDWREYRFKGKPDDPRRLPPQVAPYHHRLDWMLWFIPLSPAYGGAWFMRFLARLLEADRPTLALLRGNPFPDGRPMWVRARFFHYRFSTWRELRASGAWWVRTPVEDYVPPVRLDDLARVLDR